jgi:wyosine [tRNA(Phe)-imidazoG37] synthetase (radical SAM superfamily)
LPIAFGPVRSRRLGWSLGINNVPPKACSYSCIYCQVGATDHASSGRAAYFSPHEIVAAVQARMAECAAAGQAVDYATFVPDGEPTLDIGLGSAIRGLAALGLRVAVISNGSLLWREDVRHDLEAATWVSLKVDTVDEPLWRRLNRPIRNLRMTTVLEGMRRFAAVYPGQLMTETMLVAGVNDDIASVGRTAQFVRELRPAVAYLATPTRPPAEPWVRAPSSSVLLRSAETFRRCGLRTELLIDDVEDGGFGVVGDPTEGLLGIVAVHPMSETAVSDYLARAGADWSVAQALLDEGRIVSVRNAGRTYLRASRSRQRGGGA